MSFEQLPSNWSDQPLTDPAFAANVVDLMVSIGDRQLGTLTVILCHPDHRYRSTVTLKIPRLPAQTPTDRCRAVLEPIIPSLQASPDAPALLALGRRAHWVGPGTRPRPQVDDLDEEWAEAARTLCADAGVLLLGFYVATKDGVHQPALTALT